MNVGSHVCGLSNLRWIKSSYSGGEGGECVEVALSHTSVHIRDSKDAEGTRLTVGCDQWTEFVRFALEDAGGAL
ncbi:DUF397 domain-containing protein [Streptomyces albidus (ex Kaewkla and Franco 2022)]|uniref:DUF397 domain-containing protein n=1 Tax=Streptomyces albidus (ex Kaewkla and Franco 2022) TaxID=722709 RepID=UPI0015EF51BF|nr:DUF397 domain-containing protein [Streptomyces albidus (ex Kaewkla and Franco 2022)]